MSVGYCEPEDVRRVLREASFDGALGQDSEIVDDAILGQTQMLRRRTRRHWYDSGGAASDLVSTSPRSVGNIRLNVPSSPHRQDRQLFRGETGVRYPATYSGPYARVRLSHYDVDSLTALQVRDSDGGVEDWVASGDYTAGRGGDYYLHTSSDDEGRSHLYIRGASIGPRVDYQDLLTVGYDYGRDGVPETIRRATALLATEELVLDEDAKTAIPDQGQLVSLESKADQFHKRAMAKLEPYLEAPVA